MSKETVKGTWWKADDPATQINGEITFGPTSGATVDLYGALLSDSQPRQRFTLHGVTVRGQRVTLFDAVQKQSRLHIPGGRTSIVSSYYGIVGGHYLEPSELRFARVRVELTGLHLWTCNSGIAAKYEDRGRAIYSHTIPESVALGCYDNVVAKLEFTATTSSGLGTLSIHENCHLVLETTGLLPYETFANVFYSFQKFLALALQRPVYATQITGNIDKPEQVVHGHDVFQDFAIIRRVSIEKWDREDLIPQDLLFSLGETRSQKAFDLFFSKHQRLKPSLDLYLSTRYNPSPLVRAQFLTLAQAVEGYHRVTMPAAYVSEEEDSHLKRALVLAIPSSIPHDFRESLKIRFAYLNEFSLRKRILALCERHRNSLAPLLGPAAAFASRVSQVRNTFTHPTSTTSELVASGTEISHLSEKLALLLEVCFLDELGFSQSEIKEAVTVRSERARHVHFGAF